MTLSGGHVNNLGTNLTPSLSQSNLTQNLTQNLNHQATILPILAPSLSPHSQIQQLYPNTPTILKQVSSNLPGTGSTPLATQSIPPTKHPTNSLIGVPSFQNNVGMNVIGKANGVGLNQGLIHPPQHHFLNKSSQNYPPTIQNSQHIHPHGQFYHLNPNGVGIGPINNHLGSSQQNFSQNLQQNNPNIAPNSLQMTPQGQSVPLHLSQSQNFPQLPIAGLANQALLSQNLNQNNSHNLPQNLHLLNPNYSRELLHNSHLSQNFSQLPQQHSLSSAQSSNQHVSQQSSQQISQNTFHNFKK
jgi:hypothetical protein